jgi:hypothetical protein
VIVIWGIASFVINLVARIFIQGSSITLHLCILGFSTASLPLISAILLVFKPIYILALLVKVIGLAWSCTSAYYAYSEICIVNQGMGEKRRHLLILPIILMHTYLISLIPT